MRSSSVTCLVLVVLGHKSRAAGGCAARARRECFWKAVLGEVSNG